MCRFYIYTPQSLKQNFTVSQTITFFATNNYNSIFNVHKLCGTCSGVVQCIHAEKRAIDLQKGGVIVPGVPSGDRAATHVLRRKLRKD